MGKEKKEKSEKSEAVVRRCRLWVWKRAYMDCLFRKY